MYCLTQARITKIQKISGQTQSQKQSLQYGVFQKQINNIQRAILRQFLNNSLGNQQGGTTKIYTSSGNSHEYLTKSATVYDNDDDLPMKNKETQQIIREASRFGLFTYMNQIPEWQNTFQSVEKQQKIQPQKESTGFSITYLGTSSGTPTYYRNTQAIAVTLGDEWYLVDCGGGTVYQSTLAGLDISKLKGIFITHLHGDHQFGLVPVIKAVNDYQITQIKQQQQNQASQIDDQKGRKKSKRQESESTSEEELVDIEREIVITGPPGIFKIIYTCIQSLNLLDYMVIKLRIIEHVMQVEDQASYSLNDGHIEYITQAPDQQYTHQDNTYEQIYSYHKMAQRQQLSEDEILDCVNGLSWTMLDNNQVKVESATLHHAVPCLGYVFTEKQRATQQDTSQFQELKDSLTLLYQEIENKPKKRGRRSNKEIETDQERENKIQQLENLLREQEHTINQNKVSENQGQEFIPRKAVILGDTCNSKAIYKIGQDADVLSHEATFKEDQDFLAMRARHSTSVQAAKCAKDMNVNTVILTHFSAREDTPPTYQDMVYVPNNNQQQQTVQKESNYYNQNSKQLYYEAQRVFKGNIYMAHDFYTYNLPFKTQQSKDSQSQQYNNGDLQDKQKNLLQKDIQQYDNLEKQNQNESNHLQNGNQQEKQQVRQHKQSINQLNYKFNEKQNRQKQNISKQQQAMDETLSFLDG